MKECKGKRGRSKATVTLSVDSFSFGCKTPTVALHVWEVVAGAKKITHTFYATPEFLEAMRKEASVAIEAAGKPLIDIL